MIIKAIYIALILQKLTNSIFHSDLESKYTSAKCKEFIDKNKSIRSFNERGNPVMMPAQNNFMLFNFNLKEMYMYICDCHCDTLNKIYKFGGNLYRNCYEFDVERLIKIGKGLTFLAIQIPKGYLFEEAANYTKNLINIYFEQVRELKKLDIKVNTLKYKNDILNIKNNDCNFLLCIEDGIAVGKNLNILEEYYNLGVRLITLTWSFKNTIATGINESNIDDGLSRFGKKLISKMNDLGIIIDVSHIANKSFWDVIEYSNQPIIASHSNAFSKCDHHRNLTDNQIKAISDRKGIIGINFYPKFLNNDYKKASIEDVYKHIDYIINLIGDKNISIGTDFDGMDINASDIKGYESICDIIDYLYMKNYSKETVENIFYRNALNLLDKILI